MHLAYVKRMRLGQLEEYSYALDAATANLGFMSQRAAVGLVRAIAPHADSFFSSSSSFEGQSQELFSLLVFGLNKI